jgi:membrane protein DedA with SNARE-associated domain
LAPISHRRPPTDRIASAFARPHRLIAMDAELAQLLQRFGYPAVFIATLLEGETVMLMAGFAAHQGYLQLPLVIVSAFAGGLLGDQCLFALGRWRGPHLLARFPRLQAPAARASRLLEQHQTSIIFGIRFMYGLRTAGPLAIGMSTVPVPRFVLLNTLGAAVWATLFSVIGYAFGHGAERVLGTLRGYEKLALLGLAVVGCVVGLVHWLRRARAHRAER